MKSEVIPPTQIHVGVIWSGLGVAGNIVRPRLEEVCAVLVVPSENGPRFAGIGEDAYAEVEQVFRIDHGKDAEVLPLVPVGAAPFGVGIFLILRKPADTAGVVGIVAPGIPGKSGKALVEA